MSTAVQQFHEEEAIGKTYDWQISRRLLRYLKPYVRPLIPALLLTLTLNALGVLQPKFVQYAIDWYIVPTTKGQVPPRKPRMDCSGSRSSCSACACSYSSSLTFKPSS